MNKLSKTIVTVAFALTVSTVSNIALLAQFGGGDGTVNNPYEIHNKTHFNLLTDSVNNSTNTPNWSDGKYFILMNDITDTVRTIIGVSGSRSFQGNFDGNGFTIVLGIDIPNTSYIGLFGYIWAYNSSSVSISNLVTEGYVKGFSSVGGIVGFVFGDSTAIKNCINNCDVISSSSSRIGGIAGYAGDCHIENCINNGKISALSYIGGIVGQAIYGVKIVNCTNTGEIYSTEDVVGGIAGCCYDTVANCRNSGKISGYKSVAGISGHLHNKSKIINCINIGTVKGISIVGGISTSIDEEPNVEIFNCINSGSIIGTDRVGGILGHISSGTISNCINTGTVKGDTKTGCIVGGKAGGIIKNCHYDKQMCSGE